MKKKGIKKYQIGAEGLLGGSFKSAFSGGGSGMVNPGNANLMKMAPAQTAGMPISTPSTANPNAKSLTDIKLPAASSIPSAAKGPSFGDKAGAFMGNYGGAITSAASSLMPLLMKKPDPNAKPYKKGSKLIKYQEGTQKTIVADPNDPDNLHEYFKRRSKEAKALREASEPQGEMGPTRKEVADFMRKYNAANKNNPNIIGSIDEDEFNARAQQLQDLGISEPIKKSSPPSLIPSKQASLKFTQQSLPTPKLNKVAIDKPSRRERKAEDKRLETLARAPITYSENTFAGPSDEELKTGKAKQDAEAKQDKQLKDSFQSDVLGKTIPKSKTVSTEKNPILYKEKKNLVTYNRGDFNTFSDAEKKYYRKKIAEGVAFKIGDREYAAATPAEKAFSKRMEAKSKGGNKPDTYYKDVYNSRKSTVGKNFGTTKTPFVGAREDVITSKKEETKPENNKQVNTNTQESSTNKTTVSEFNLKAIMAKKKELADLRSNVPGFGPFRSSSNSKLVGDIDNINRQLYKISQKQAAFERNKTRGLGDVQALKEAKARELEFKNLTKNLKFK